MDFVKVEHSLPSKSGRYLCVAEFKDISGEKYKWMGMLKYDANHMVFEDEEYQIQEEGVTHWAEIAFPK